MANTEQDIVHVNPEVLSGVGYWGTDGDEGREGRQRIVEGQIGGCKHGGGGKYFSRPHPYKYFPMGFGGGVPTHPSIYP
jgi:hypothetical protein